MGSSRVRRHRFSSGTALGFQLVPCMRPGEVVTSSQRHNAAAVLVLVLDAQLVVGVEIC